MLPEVLTVTADGALPIAHRLCDGNTTDDQTHIATWEQLCRLVGRSDFLYVADCKLATTVPSHLETLSTPASTLRPPPVTSARASRSTPRRHQR
ncbi:MAG: hypothetical protein ACRDNS_24520 [Trebonia sp.]